MKKLVLLALLLALVLGACADPGAPKASSDTTPTQRDETAVSSGLIYLFAEGTATERFHEKELEFWDEFYAGGMRDLFLETSYCKAAYLNEWMQADSDDVLLRLFDDGIEAEETGSLLAFYRVIKEQYPETVFHGTDVGHEFSSLGERYLSELREAGLENSESYALAKENNEQGVAFYDILNYDVLIGLAYQENVMAQNFIREFEHSGSNGVMGIYSLLHADSESLCLSGNAPSMAQQIASQYGGAVHSLRLTDELTVKGKPYAASYCGEYSASHLNLGFDTMEIWQSDAAYADLCDCPRTEVVFPSSGFRLPPKEKTVLIVDFTSAEGTRRWYFLSDGIAENGQAVMVQILPD